MALRFLVTWMVIGVLINVIEKTCTIPGIKQFWYAMGLFVGRYRKIKRKGIFNRMSFVAKVVAGALIALIFTAIVWPVELWYLCTRCSSKEDWRFFVQ